MVPLQAPMALLGRGNLPEQFRVIVRPPAVGQAGPLAGYACKIVNRFNVSRPISSLSRDVRVIANILPIGGYSGAGNIEIAGLAILGPE